jgi:hypothetical protein
VLILPYVFSILFILRVDITMGSNIKQPLSKPQRPQPELLALIDPSSGPILLYWMPRTFGIPPYSQADFLGAYISLTTFFEI